MDTPREMETYDYYDGPTHIIVHRPVMTPEERRAAMEMLCLQMSKILNREVTLAEDAGRV